MKTYFEGGTISLWHYRRLSGHSYNPPDLVAKSVNAEFAWCSACFAWSFVALYV